ncbi:unnamed protein product, partial [Adineta steineri]
DLRSLTIHSLTKTENATYLSTLTTMNQSISFTTGTFSSITTDKSSRLSSTNQGPLNINQPQKLD